MKVVICGGGIMGVATAYYLSLKGVAATIIDRYGIACGASGMAGALLPRDLWDSKTDPLGTLAEKGFDMHAELSKQFSDCGYRRISYMQTKVQKGSAPVKRADKFDWIDGPVTDISLRRSTDVTLQVLPKKLTQALFSAAEKRGASFVSGNIEQINLNRDKSKVTGVTVDGQKIKADVVVIALGPWSKRVAPWLDIPLIETTRAHSVIFRPIGLTDTPYTFRLDVPVNLPDVEDRPLEIQLRCDGTLFVWGPMTKETLPDDPEDVSLNEPVLKRLEEIAQNLSSKLAAAEEQSYEAGALSYTPDNLPCIGQVPGKEGCYIITGHNAAGILTAPSSCAALAELIVTGHSTLLDLTPFDPSRF